MKAGDADETEDERSAEASERSLRAV